MKKIIIAVIILAIATAVFLVISSNKNGDNGDTYRFTTVTRGSLENSITSTGVIKAVGTVDIGTQVSGTIASIFVDFNDRVSKNQLLAVLDTAILKESVLEAEASIEISEAQLAETLADYNRNLPLVEKGFISRAEFLPIETNLQVQQATLRSNQSRLERAQRNLDYALIRSPINGTVIQRNVEEGQTVAASLSAPVLFVVAEDLARMEIHAQVDESDIGQIREGQEIRFSVLAYPDEEFHGTVQQIRLQPETVSNVVNYTVIILADNDDLLLLPGMTATVDFIIESRENALMVANAALQYQPPFDHEEIPKGMTKPPMPSMVGAVERTGKPMPENSKSSGKVGHLWMVDSAGRVIPVTVRTGLTDGRSTEIISEKRVREGMQFLIGSSKSGSTNAANRKMPGGMPPIRGLRRI